MIGLADCNNFYASCERVFNPKLQNKPVFLSCPQDAFGFDLRAANKVETEEKNIELQVTRDGVCIGLIVRVCVTSLLQIIKYSDFHKDCTV